MREQIKIRSLDERGQYTQMNVEAGCTLLEVISRFHIEQQAKYPIIAAYVNNEIRELSYRIYQPITVSFIDISSYAGVMVYQRTISFIIQCAIEELFPNLTLYIRHSMGGNGIYCEVECQGDSCGTPYRLTPEDIDNIERRMRDIVDADIEIIRELMPTEQLREIYIKRGYLDKIALLETRPRLYSELYMLRGSINFFFGALAPSTGYISNFTVEPYYNGIYLALPMRSDPNTLAQSPHQEKMFDIFRLNQEWVDIMGVQTVGTLNKKVLAGDSSEMIKVAEALMERSLSRVADDIAEQHKVRGCRMVLLAGPSSSGKTTTAKRIGVQLQVLGFRPVLISLDDYFVDRIHTPRDENGEYDFEALEAINLELFNRHLSQLFDGESVDIPRYDFISGTSCIHEKPLQLCDNSILIVEGIHGLNPALTPQIPNNLIYRIYASCFTTVSMDNTSRILSSDNRLIRRLTRDFATRGNSAQQTLQRWTSVRHGEERYIYPYQENADRMINTAMFYELAVLKPFAEKILRDVPNTGAEYQLAQRMLHFLDQFVTIDPTEIPPTSTLREFIGGGSFK